MTTPSAPPQQPPLLTPIPNEIVQIINYKKEKTK